MRMEQINSSLDNETATTNLNNINIPQLTDARKQEIRKKLLERQRQARLQSSNRNSTSKESTSSSTSTLNNNTNSNTTTTNTINNDIIDTSNSKSNEENESPPNKEMVKKAVAFLSSPKVRNASTSKKHSFLMSKGCTKKEIELAEKEIEEKGLLSGNLGMADLSSTSVPSINYNQNQSQIPPPLPPRIYPQNVQIVYRNQPLTRSQKVKRGLLIILFGGVFIKGISIVVKEQIMKPLRELYFQYAKYLRNRNNTLNKYILQVIEYCALFINNKNKDNIKYIKTIKEIENEKNNEKEKAIILKEKEDDHIKEEKEESEIKKEKEKEIKNKKESQPRKAIKLKIHKKKEIDNENNESTPLSLDNKDSNSNLNSTEVRTLSVAVQDYIRKTNEFEEKCKDAIDTYAYDLERNSDLFSGSLGQTMKLSSEVYQMVSREFYYNSSSSSSFYVDPYNSQDSENNNGSISLYTRVNNIKSDIRRLKGMLLNHRNFPKYKQRVLANNSVNTASSSSPSS